MDAHARLLTRVQQEQDDLLDTIQLVVAEPDLQDRLFEQLTDLLVEGMFLDLRNEFLLDEITREEYVEQLGDLAERCRDLGLLPLPSRPI